MKICDIVQFHSPLSGGVKRYIGDKIGFFAQQRDVQHVVVVPSMRNHVRLERRSRVYEIKSPPLLGSRSYRMLLARRRILALLQAERPDLIEVDDPYRSAWIALEAGRLLNVPVVAFYHSDYPRALDRTLERFAGNTVSAVCAAPIQRYLVSLYNRMDATIVATQRFRDALRALGIRRLTHIPLGTDTRAFYPRPSRAAIRSELGLPADARLLLSACRLSREKNVRAIVAMMDLLPPDGRPTHLVLVGDGELAGWVQRRAARRPNIAWLGYCDDNERLAALYSAADLLVHAGTAETFGLVSVEAQACGTPVLGVRGGGLEESLRCEPRPLLADAPTPEALARAVQHALRRPEDASARHARAARVRGTFCIQNTCRRSLALYRSLYAERRRAAAAPAPSRRQPHEEVITP
ncbi:MAG: glycosyltransferase [Lentisphaerae bacterium]|nr:glycosyltransferase [Lentisphaerota bacterium]